MTTSEQLIDKRWQELDEYTKKRLESAGVTNLVKGIAVNFFYGGHTAGRDAEREWIGRIVGILIGRRPDPAVPTPPASFTAQDGPSQANGAGLRPPAVGEGTLPAADQ